MIYPWITYSLMGVLALISICFFCYWEANRQFDRVLARQCRVCAFLRYVQDLDDDRIKRGGIYRGFYSRRLPDFTTMVELTELGFPLTLDTYYTDGEIARLLPYPTTTHLHF